MQKKTAEEMVEMFARGGFEAEVARRPSNRRSWAVSFVMDISKQEDLEDILIKFNSLKLKIESEPNGITEERVYLY